MSYPQLVGKEDENSFRWHNYFPDPSWYVRKNGAAEESGLSLTEFLPTHYETDLAYVNFYCSAFPVATNFLEFLTNEFGKMWPCLQYNKCNNPRGKYWQKNWKICDPTTTGIAPCYIGAGNYLRVHQMNL